MFNPTIQALIADTMPQAILEKRLTANLLALIYEQRWFNLWVPKAYGGMEYSLPEGCALLEELAYADGGLAWTVTLCAGANMFAGFLEPSLATRIFSQPDVCWGGSGRPSGRAEKTAGGYRISGAWKYATGAPHLTHFTLNAWLYEEGEVILDAAGEPVYSSFFVDRDDVLIHYDWDTFGLEVTASHSFSVEGLYVAANRAFDLQPAKRTTESPLYYYPFMSFAACTLAVNYMGMFRKFMGLYEKLLFQRANDPKWQAEKGKELFKELDLIGQAFEVKKVELYQLMDSTWAKSDPDAEQLERIMLLSKEIVALIREETSRLFPHTGIVGAQRENELNIVFRNIFTATQHALLGC